MKKIQSLVLNTLIISELLATQSCESCGSSKGNTDQPNPAPAGTGSNPSGSTGTGPNPSSSTGTGPNPSSSTGTGPNPSGSTGTGPNPSSSTGIQPNPPVINSNMINSISNVGYDYLVEFVKKMQKGEAVNINDKVHPSKLHDSTPLGVLCTLFTMHYGGVGNDDAYRLELFDYLVSQGASLEGKVNNGKSIIEYLTDSPFQPKLALLRHILQNKDKMNSSELDKAYEAAKTHNSNAVLKVFEDAGFA